MASGKYTPPTVVDDDDEVITVTLTRGDYSVMREMIDKQKSLNWIGRYTRNVLFVAAGGLITLITFWDHIAKLLFKS